MTTTFLMNTQSIIEDFDYYYNTVNQERKNKVDKLKLLPDKELSLTAGVLLKKSLEYYGIDYANSKFEYNQNDKPYIKNNLYFNLSHSGEYVICSVSKTEVGCDIQLIKPVKQELIDMVCSVKERDFLLQFKDDNKYKEFTKLWTKKESYVKYLGVGITRTADTFNIKDVYFKEYELKGYSICVCNSTNEFDYTLQIFR